MTRANLWRTAIAGLAVAALSSVSRAQMPVQPQPKDPNMPAQQNTVPEKMGTPGTDATGTLSDRLQRSDGVITPPDTSPSMTVPAPVPNPGTTPVIPPAGTPGSAQPDAAPK